MPIQLLGPETGRGAPQSAQGCGPCGLAPALPCGVYGLRGAAVPPLPRPGPRARGQGPLRSQKCGECRKQFTVKVGPVFEHARLPLTKRLQAVHSIVSSKKGIGSHQLSRVLEVQYKSAWFLAHRIREAMRSGDLAQPFGFNGGAVKVDETYIGFKRDFPTNRNRARVRAAAVSDRRVDGVLCRQTAAGDDSRLIPRGCGQAIPPAKRRRDHRRSSKE